MESCSRSLGVGTFRADGGTVPSRSGGGQVTNPYGGTSWTSPPSTAAPPRPPSTRPSRWATVGPPVVLACLVAVVLAVHFVGDRGSATRPPSATGAPGSAVPSAALEGEWSGEGSLTFCAGFDEGCPATRSVSLTIDCREQPCAVTPFDRSYGRPPLTFEDGSYRAAGPVPADVAPTCDGARTSSALWRLELTVRNGRLAGRYAESTVQGFDCGATGVEWRIAFERR
jgi:hypothetical protein